MSLLLLARPLGSGVIDTPVTVDKADLQPVGQTVDGYQTAEVLPISLSAVGSTITFAIVLPVTVEALQISEKDVTLDWQNLNDTSMDVDAAALQFTGQNVGSGYGVLVGSTALQTVGQDVPLQKIIEAFPANFELAGSTLTFSVSTLASVDAAALQPAMQSSVFRWSYPVRFEYLAVGPAPLDNLTYIWTTSVGLASLQLTGQNITIGPVLDVVSAALQLAGQGVTLHTIQAPVAATLSFAGQDVSFKRSTPENLPTDTAYLTIASSVGFKVYLPVDHAIPGPVGQVVLYNWKPSVTPALPSWHLATPISVASGIILDAAATQITEVLPISLSIAPQNLVFYPGIALDVWTSQTQGVWVVEQEVAFRVGAGLTFDAAALSITEPDVAFISDETNRSVLVDSTALQFVGKNVPAQLPAVEALPVSLYIAGKDFDYRFNYGGYNPYLIVDFTALQPVGQDISCYGAISIIEVLPISLVISESDVRIGVDGQDTFFTFDTAALTPVYDPDPDAEINKRFDTLTLAAVGQDVAFSRDFVPPAIIFTFDTATLAPAGSAIGSNQKLPVTHSALQPTEPFIYLWSNTGPTIGVDAPVIPLVGQELPCHTVWPFSEAVPTITESDVDFFMGFRVTGVEGTVELGTVVVTADAVVLVTGVVGTTAVNLGIIWGIINDSQTGSWVSVPDTQTGGWTPVDDAQVTVWTRIAA